jgi:hypothetical protein
MQGCRWTCIFVSPVYWLSDLFKSQAAAGGAQYIENFPTFAEQMIIFENSTWSVLGHRSTEVLAVCVALDKPSNFFYNSVSLCVTSSW